MASQKRDRVPEPGEVNYEGPASHGGFNAGTVHPSGYPGVVAKDGKYAICEVEENRATTAGTGFPDVEEEVCGLLDRSGARKELGLERGNVPAFKTTTPGMSVMTIDVPSSQSKEAWGNFLQLLYVCDGVLVLRPSCESRPNEDSVLNSTKFLQQVYEIVDSRPMNIVCIVDGPIRGNMMMFPAMATLVLATKDASFGLPTFQQKNTNSAVHDALKKRLSRGCKTQYQNATNPVLNRLMFVGDTIDANEAHRLNVADFVGDEEAVENELSRLIFAHCSPHVTYYMHKRDLNRAVEEKEAQEEGEDSDSEMPRLAAENLYPF